jgi:hypothetical protein
MPLHFLLPIGIAAHSDFCPCFADAGKLTAVKEIEKPFFQNRQTFFQSANNDNQDVPLHCKREMNRGYRTYST